MCTVTYLPVGNASFILTSNRDEAPLRNAAEIVETVGADGKHLHFPKDPKAGGTWLCVADTGRIICLLNGAFKKHDRKPPYRRSRGLVLLDAFEYENIDRFFADYALKGIEPFTMVVCDSDRLFELRWDGNQKHLLQMDADKPYIWSSATLYSEAFIKKRSQWFELWLDEHPDFRQKDIIAFHKYGGEGDSTNDFVMNRFNVVRTVSISSIEKKQSKIELLHLDLLNQKTSRCNIERVSSVH